MTSRAMVQKPKIMLILSENWTLVDGQDLRTLVDWAVAAETAGIDAVMLSEHVSLGPAAGANGREKNNRAYMAPGNQDPATPWPSSLLLMSAIAARTSVLRIFGGAVIAPLRHPVQLAKDLATLDCLANGRLIVQPTVSWHEEEYRQLGVSFNQRGKLLDEHLQAWRLLWSESPASFSGEFYNFEDCYLEPKPWRSGGPRSDGQRSGGPLSSGPLLWFGGQAMSGPVLRRLVEYGSGFHPFGAPSKADFEKLGSAMDAAGRSMAELELVGGIRADLPDHDAPADLAQAMHSIPPQMEQGFTTFCVKPNQFMDGDETIEDFCARLVQSFGQLSA